MTILVQIVVTALVSVQPSVAAEPSVTALLAADSTFSAAAAAQGIRPALDRFLADDVIVPLPGGTFARGAAAARDALDRAPYSTGTVTWKPIGAGISADGTHGFTFGFITVARADSAPTYAKYMTYWEKQEDGWRVRAHKRAPSEADVINQEQLEPALSHPPPVIGAEAQRAEDRRSLAAAEAEFSAEAQRVGLRNAFTRFGREDAVNMGPPDRGFIIGAASIGEAVGGAAPVDSSPVSWAADYDVIVSPAGDLGVTFGIIRRNGADAAAPGFAFFTIWSRPDRSAPWRYITE